MAKLQRRAKTRRTAGATSRPAAQTPRGELSLIAAIAARAAKIPGGAALRLGIGDDCAALLPPGGHEVLVTTDFSLEGRHFRRDWHPARSVGHRALARGLSDLAAMGAEPMAAFLSLALPPLVAADERWCNGFVDGLLALAETFGITLAGGDSAQAPGDLVLADIVLLGSAPAGTALRRSGARPGDALFVTGTLGGSAAELEQLAADPAPFRAAQTTDRSGHPHLFPSPRVAVGRALRERGLATACIDLSDGLSTDLAHLCAASGVAATIDRESLPLSTLLRGRSADERERLALHGGEDYELLFTAPAERPVPKSIAGVRLTRIGVIERAAKTRPQVRIIRDGGKPTALEARGWEHFRER